MNQLRRTFNRPMRQPITLVNPQTGARATLYPGYVEMLLRQQGYTELSGDEDTQPLRPVQTDVDEEESGR